MLLLLHVRGRRIVDEMSGWFFWEGESCESLTTFLYSTRSTLLHHHHHGNMGRRAGKYGVMIPQLYLGKVGTYFTFYGVRSSLVGQPRSLST